MRGGGDLSRGGGDATWAAFGEGATGLGEAGTGEGVYDLGTAGSAVGTTAGDEETVVSSILEEFAESKPENAESKDVSNLGTLLTATVDGWDVTADWEGPPKVDPKASSKADTLDASVVSIGGKPAFFEAEEKSKLSSNAVSKENVAAAAGPLEAGSFPRA